MIADPTLLATTQIVTAWFGVHEIAVADVPELIEQVHASLTYREPYRPPAERMAPAKPGRKLSNERSSGIEPAVSIRKSVFADHLVCLEDGKSFKTLARHLNEMHGMSPQEYRARWGLPGDYPMVAPDYAETRSRISREMGLGRKRVDGRGSRR
jgi:predicted transcriptional regulator